jgi:exodeoxyribonuclease VII small subunit
MAMMAKTGSKTDSTKAAQPDFEAALSRLEKIVEKLDDGNLPLAESLALFKEGTKLAKLCRELLDQAELAVKDALREERRDEQSEDSQDQP